MAKELNKKEVFTLLSENGRGKRPIRGTGEDECVKDTTFSKKHFLDQVFAEHFVPVMDKAMDDYAEEQIIVNSSNFARWCLDGHIYYREGSGWLKADDPGYGPFTDRQIFEFYQRDQNKTILHNAP